MTIGLNRFRTSISQIRFCNGGPTSRHSFNEGLCSPALADASYTIRCLVVSASSLTTILCGMKNCFFSSVIIDGTTSSTIPSCSWVFMISSYNRSFSGSRTSFFREDANLALLLNSFEGKSGWIGFHNRPVW